MHQSERFCNEIDYLRKREIMLETTHLVNGKFQKSLIFYQISAVIGQFKISL